jgi:hypothetical protein
MFGDANAWNGPHNKHHATPQKIGHDIDLDTAPLVAFYDSSSLEKGRNTSYITHFLI